jgi:hypothetical protein
MRCCYLCSSVAAFLAASAAAQGTFIYDQQSSTDETPWPVGSGGLAMQEIPAPWGQSFTPALGQVDFIRLLLYSHAPPGQSQTSVYINLRSDSLTGPIIATTDSVSLQYPFTGPVNFFFPMSIPLAPGATYFFDPHASGGYMNLANGSYNYPGGYAYANGLPLGGDDWFREGIVVPEPSSTALMVLAVAALTCRARPGRRQ